MYIENLQRSSLHCPKSRNHHPHKLAHLLLGAGAMRLESTAGGVLSVNIQSLSLKVFAALSACVAVDMYTVCAVLCQDNVHEALSGLLFLDGAAGLSQVYPPSAALGLDIVQ